MIPLKSKFKRLVARFIIWANSKKTKTELNDNIKTCLKICRRLIKDNNSKFLIAPISGKKYIKNSELGLFVILDGGKVSITNHVYHYDIFLEFKEWEKISNMFDSRVETDRQKYENEIRSQIEFSLQTILDKVSVVTPN